MKRFQARRGNGRFIRNTMENTFGLHCAVCPYDDCRRLNPTPVGEPQPTHCHACQRPYVPPRGAQCTFTLDGREYLVDIMRAFTDQQGETMIETRHFNGETGPTVRLGTVTLLERTYTKGDE